MFLGTVAQVCFFQFMLLQMEVLELVEHVAKSFPVRGQTLSALLEHFQKRVAATWPSKSTLTLGVERILSQHLPIPFRVVYVSQLTVVRTCANTTNLARDRERVDTRKGLCAGSTLLVGYFFC